MTQTKLQRIVERELIPGDVLLSLGRGDLSAGIRELDGGHYSHGSLWTGSDVIEATLPCVRRVALSALSERSEHVDVYRGRPSAQTASAIVTAAAGYLERPYGAINLGVCTLSTALASLMPGDWSKLNLMLGVGGLGKLIGAVSTLTRRFTGSLSVTCVELVGRAYADAGAPRGVRLDTPGHFDPEAFLRALREVLSRLPEDIRGAPELEWLARVELHAALGSENPDEWLPARREWLRFLAEEASRDPTTRAARNRPRSVVRPQHLQLPVSEIRRMELKAGLDWPAALLTPRLLQTSPSLTCAGRVALE